MRKILAFLLMLSMLAAFAGCNKPVTPSSPEAGKTDKTEAASAGETPVSETPEPTILPGTYTELALVSMERSMWLFPYPHEGSIFELLLSAKENAYEESGILKELIKVRADEEIEPVYPNAYETCTLSEAIVYLDMGCVSEFSFNSFGEALDYAREHVGLSPVVDLILKQDGNEVGYAFAVTSGASEKLGGGFNKDGWLKIIWDGTEVLPFEYRALGDKLVSYAGLAEEGPILGLYLPEIYRNLPGVGRENSFELKVYEWASVYRIDVYDGSFVRAAQCLSLKEFYEYAKQHPEELIVDVRLFVPGCEIFEEPVEREGMGYAFVLCRADEYPCEQAELAPEDHLVLTDGGARLMPHICPLYSTRYFEEGGGFLHGDSIEFFDRTLRLTGDLPEVGADFEYSVGENCRITQINVYDPDSLEGISLAISAQELEKLVSSLEGSVIVEMHVLHTGRYIEAADDNECEAFSYAFIVTGDTE